MKFESTVASAFTAVGLGSLFSGTSAEQYGAMPLPGHEDATVVPANVVLIGAPSVEVKSTVPDRLTEVYESNDPEALKYPCTACTIHAGETIPIQLSFTRSVPGSDIDKTYETWGCSLTANGEPAENELYVFRVDPSSQAEYPFITGKSNGDAVSFDCTQISAVKGATQ